VTLHGTASTHYHHLAPGALFLRLLPVHLHDSLLSLSRDLCAYRTLHRVHSACPYTREQPRRQCTRERRICKRMVARLCARSQMHLCTRLDERGGFCCG
jgi:hypothetical protein